MYIHQGVGNLGTHSVIDTARVVAEVLDFPWENVRRRLGQHGKGVAWSSIQAGSQTTHAHTRANLRRGHRTRKRKLQELAARGTGRQRRTAIASAARASPGPGGSLTWAQAAERAIKRGGKFDGHELPADINAMTKASAPRSPAWA